MGIQLKAWKQRVKEYDPMMSYMGTKNREVGRDLNVDIAGKIVLMLHDFLDSPHVYRWMLFADFWDWATQTIDYCIMEGLPLAVKPHPNSVESNGTAERLRQKYSKSENVDWISPKITNSIIFAQKPDLIVSAYGYVLMEAAYKGIPGLVTGDYPGINFDIARQPNDRGEYFKALKSFRDIRSGKRDDAIILNALIANTAKKNNNMHLMSKFSRSRKECENINFLNSEATNDHLTDASIFMHKEIESFMLKMKRNEDIN